MSMGLIVVALIGFNSWWYWRDNHPVADLKAIASWLAQEQYALAEPALREHIRRSPHNGEVRMMLGRLLAARGDYIGCARQLQEIAPWWPTKVEALYREGQAYLMANRAKDAEAAWLKAIEDDPLHPGPPDVVHDASLELLKLYSTEERWEELHDILWNAYERADPQEHLALLSMRVLSELERIAPAASINQLERYAAADPTDWEALRALARAEFALGRKEEAGRHFEMYSQAQPDNPRGWRDYLTMVHDLGDLDAWVSLLARLPPSADSDPEIWKFRGLQKEKAGNWTGAADDYRQALERNPYLTSAHYRLAMVEERLGHRTIAADHRKQTEALREAQSNLRLAYADVMNAEAAREKQTPVSPDLPTSLRRLATICETLGWARLAEALSKLADSK
jgi:tetratricopeptide (TPR) repeat protein